VQKKPSITQAIRVGSLAILLKDASTVVLGGLVLYAFYLLSERNYLLFHSLVEVLSIVVAGSIFMIFWNARRFLDSDFLLVLGVAYLFVGAIDLLHALAYKGMGVFPGYDSNLPTQLWVAARYVQSFSFLAGLYFLRRRVNMPLVFLGYLLVFLLLLAVIFCWGVFPDAYIEGSGLTPFKRGSEYLISLLFAASLVVLYRNRRVFEPGVLQLLGAALIAAIASELAFTSYVSVYGFANALGHLFKVVSVYLVYRAFVVVGLQRPYDLIFRDLAKSDQALRDLNDSLETQVEERTAQVRSLASALSLAEQRERQRIAQVLHDDLQQLLYSQLMRLQIVRSAASYAEGPTSFDQLNDIEGLTNQALGLTRNLVSQLRPPSFETNSLEEGLAWLARRMEEAHGLQVHLSARDACCLESRDVRTLVLQVVRELLFNVVKHAGVTEAQLALWRDDGCIRVRVEDEGVGFAMDAVDTGQPAGSGLGLSSVAERLALVGGSLEVDSALGSGTRVTVSVPAPDPESVQACRCAAARWG
jgi:signal transduction histidine kinase